MTANTEPLAAQDHARSVAWRVFCGAIALPAVQDDFDPGRGYDYEPARRYAPGWDMVRKSAVLAVIFTPGGQATIDMPLTSTEATVVVDARAVPWLTALEPPA